METVTPRDSLSASELRSALDTLSRVTLVRLHKKAEFLASGTGMEPSDILHQAVVRALEKNGGRNCPRDVEPETFLGNVMRSIASHARKKWARETPTGTNDDDKGDPIVTMSDPTPSLEETVIGRLDCGKMISQVETMFSEDPKALAVVIGLMEGWAPHEIREMESMTDKQYDAARKRVRRALLREYQKGSIYE